MEDFLHAYIACALWSSTDEDGEPLDALYSADDLAPEAIESMREDCEDFQAANAVDLDATGATDAQNGHDFWLTRNGHGAGFWDRGYDDDLGERLTNAAHAYGSSDLYVGDDGVLYVS